MLTKGRAPAVDDLAASGALIAWMREENDALWVTGRRWLR